MHYYYFFIFSQYSSKMLYLLHKFLLLSKNNFVLCRKRACSGQSFTECYLLKMLLKTRDGWSNDFRKCDLLHWNFRGSEMFCRKETWLSLFSSVQFSHSVVSDSLWLDRLQHTRPLCPSLTPRSYPNSCFLSRWCYPTISSFRPLLLPPSIFPSITVFSNESALCIRWPKYWSFSFNISPSNEHSRLISFRIDWLDLLVVQGTLKSLLQHHSSKVSILLHSAFFIVQLSHPYMTTEKTIALTRRTLVGKVMPLLLNMLSRLVITFLPRRKRLLISWLQSPSAVILEPKKKSLSLCRVSHDTRDVEIRVSLKSYQDLV